MAPQQTDNLSPVGKAFAQRRVSQDVKLVGRNKSVPSGVQLQQIEEIETSQLGSRKDLQSGDRVSRVSFTTSNSRSSHRER